jgi:hypothetical protein
MDNLSPGSLLRGATMRLGRVRMSLSMNGMLV